MKQNQMMEISHRQIKPGAEVIALAGKLTLGVEGDHILTLVDELLAQGTRLFIFDLSGVANIDSTGIGRFIASFNKIMAAGGEMRMAGAAGHVFQSFRVSLLDKVFRFYPNVDAAL
jgi:anti-anti-sigma factor